MTDERMDQLMDEAMASYRAPKEPPLDAIWARVEREHFDAPRVGAAAPHAAPHAAPEAPHRRPLRAPLRWMAPVAGIAATLLVGIGIGRYTATPATPVLPMVADATPRDADSLPVTLDPLQRTTSSLLRDAETLLASAPLESQAVDAAFVDHARSMLMSTRLLMDSPAGSDPVMRAMLEDLELILAQFARLRAAPRAEELTFIADAMDERDVVPRLRTVAASLSHFDY
jgi:hypothetical protein